MMVVLVTFLITDDLNQKQGPTLGIKGIPKEEACLHRSSKVQRASNLTIRNALWQKLLPNPPIDRASREKCSTSSSSAPHRIHMRSSFPVQPLAYAFVNTFLFDKSHMNILALKDTFPFQTDYSPFQFHVVLNLHTILFFPKSINDAEFGMREISPSTKHIKNITQSH